MSWVNGIMEAGDDAGSKVHEFRNGVRLNEVDGVAKELSSSWSY